MKLILTDCFPFGIIFFCLILKLIAGTIVQEGVFSLPGSEGLRQGLGTCQLGTKSASGTSQLEQRGEKVENDAGTIQALG